MKRNTIKYWLAALLMLILSCAAALAAHTGSIRVTVTNMDDVPVPDLTVTLYTVVDSRGSLCHDFNYNRTGLTRGMLLATPHSPEYARILARCAADYAVAGDTRKTDTNGAAHYTDVNEGLYLVVGQIGSVCFDPFLVPMPILVNDVPDYSIEATPKVEYAVVPTPTPTPTPGVTPTPTPTPGVTPSPTPTPDVTPTPTPTPGVTPTPTPTPDVTPTPTPTPDVTSTPAPTPSPSPSEDPDGPKIPQTGVNIWPMYTLLVLGILLILAGFVELLRGRKERRHE